MIEGSREFERGKVSGLKKVRKHVLVCVHKDCAKRGGKEALRELKGALKKLDLRDSVLINRVECFDQCEHAPVVVVYPDGVWYGEVDEEGAREIARRQVAEGRHAEAGCRVLRDMRGGGGQEG